MKPVEIKAQWTIEMKGKWTGVWCRMLRTLMSSTALLANMSSSEGSGYTPRVAKDHSVLATF